MDSFTPSLTSIIKTAYRKSANALLNDASNEGFWEGELSGSALSTATALTAASLWRNSSSGKSDLAWDDSVFEKGFKWLFADQNEDGGWGDTDRSLSNVSTTALVWGALKWIPQSLVEEGKVAEEKAENWLMKYAGSLEPRQLSACITARYGKDRTFSVPILTLLSLCGRLGPEPNCWRLFPALPYELSVFPKEWYAVLKLPVVSYALPALIAMGVIRAHRGPSRNPLARWIRSAAEGRSLGVLESIQPENGGFLEATPLTSFVSMSLIGAGLDDLLVTRRCLDFLAKSQRSDGCWPIDTHLATWGTTLSLGALSDEDLLGKGWSWIAKNLRWLLDQQYQTTHPYTNAAPGGWAWTPLPGGVPDADDTPGAMLALLKWRRILEENRTQWVQEENPVRRELEALEARIEPALELGARWLMGLQNSDGGIPTFCRGWGSLPFDRSSADLTAHTLRAWTAIESSKSSRLWNDQLERASRKALGYLENTQAANGQWTPLWFGNQYLEEEENPVYGTSRAILALAEILPGPFGQRNRERISSMAQKGAAALIKMRHPNNSWGGVEQEQASVEETALALEGLAALARAEVQTNTLGEQLSLSAEWLAEKIEDGTWIHAAPIGFYFAKLWYYEELYPKIWSVSALRRIQ